MQEADRDTVNRGKREKLGKKNFILDPRFRLFREVKVKKEVQCSLVLIILLGFILTGEASDSISRSRYLVKISGCNDCHTKGYLEKEGAVPEKNWLLGISEVGWRGPWGTTYGTSRRLFLKDRTEDVWLNLPISCKKYLIKHFGTLYSLVRNDF